MGWSLMNIGENNFIVLMIASIALMLSFALSLLAFFNRSQKKILKASLKTQEIEAAHQKQLLESSIQIEERERARIARELHDDLGSKLGVLNLKLQSLRQKKLKIEEEDMTELHKILDQSINTTRRISHDLLPPIFMSFGIHAALEDLMVQINTSKTVQLEINSFELINISSRSNQLNLFRIIQELISNSLKHGKAKQIDISFSSEDGILLMEYKDNGIGFKKTENGTHQGLGMRNIESRTMILNGEIIIDNTLEKSVNILLKIPNS